MDGEINYDTIEAILFFIKNVDDKDIGSLISKLSNNFYNGSLGLFEEREICNKDHLLYLLLNQSECMNDIVMAIDTIYLCYTSYNLWKKLDKKTHNKLKTLLKKSEIINDIQGQTGVSKLIYVNDKLRKVNKEALIDCNNPFPNEIKNIMHILIEDFVNNKLYIILDEDLFPLNSLRNDNLRCFKISKQEDKTYFLEYTKSYLKDNRESFKETGLQLVINISKKQWKNAHGIKAFKKIHEELVKLVSYNPETCNWCNPDVNTKTRHRCDNCMNLFDELKNYTSSFDYVRKINEINYNNSVDIKTLRDKRKEIIRKWIENSNASKMQKKQLCNLLDSTFAVKNI